MEELFDLSHVESDSTFFKAAGWGEISGFVTLECSRIGVYDPDLRDSHLDVLGKFFAEVLHGVFGTSRFKDGDGRMRDRLFEWQGAIDNRDVGNAVILRCHLDAKLREDRDVPYIGMTAKPGFNCTLPIGVAKFAPGSLQSFAVYVFSVGFLTGAEVNFQRGPNCSCHEPSFSSRFYACFCAYFCSLPSRNWPASSWLLRMYTQPERRERVSAGSSGWLEPMPVSRKL